jgi:ATP-dependent Lon protease
MLQLVSNFAAEPTKSVLSSAAAIAMHSAAGQTSATGASAGQSSSTTVVLREQHYEIAEGSTGYTYERIFRPYIDRAQTIRVEDSYIRFPYQVDNFSRFCALAVRLGEVRRIELICGADFGENTDDADSRLETLRRDLEGRGIKFSYRRDSNLHDREVRFDNSWVVKVGRGLDIYHKPESWVSMEAADFSLRRCKRTKVDIFRSDNVLD